MDTQLRIFFRNPSQRGLEFLNQPFGLQHAATITKRKEQEGFYEYRQIAQGLEQGIKGSRSFEEAEGDEAVLVIDEADSVRFSRDRARRSWEISFTNELLILMEHFRGILICTTHQALGRRRRFDLDGKLVKEGDEAQTVCLGQARREVEPFVRYPQSLEVRSKTFFRDVAGRIRLV